ncbi:nucleopolyhedrovirus P10 family protein [Streptomyces sp. NPDC058371]|uniref:nucleopolyhedrovirus P10 family protein n=1 Tax=Streptomyces sp. NPDC058371 TaxID=3346463 RepID=UPI00365EA298
MTADRWTQAVRNQLGLGRLLPLGDARDGAWITEEAARSSLRYAAHAVRGVRLGALRVALADPELLDEPAVPPPPSALPPGPLRLTGEFAAAADPTAQGAEPLPATAARLRGALLAAATGHLGLRVTEVDLRVTGLLDADETPEAVRPADAVPAALPADVEEARVAAAALAVPGVTRLTDAMGQPVHIEDRPEDGAGGGTALPRRHVRVEFAVSADTRAVDVARAVRATVAEALPEQPSVAVVVTMVDRRPGVL